MGQRFKSCPLCGATEICDVFSMKNFPVLNNAVCKTAEEALTYPVGELDFKTCMVCHFTWNDAFEHNRLTYDANYENNQSYSSLFLSHIDAVINEMRLATHSHVVEIGCGQGYFLHRLKELKGNYIDILLGFDPAVRHENRELIRGMLDKKKFPAFFSPTHFISRHVIEHIDNINLFLSNIKENIPNAKFGFFETPDVDWIFENNAYYDFYYEHCSLFSAEALCRAMHRVGFPYTVCKYLFGGQYLLVTGSYQQTRPNMATDIVKRNSHPESFKNNFSLYLEHWENLLLNAKATGKKIAVWGGASKCVAFLNHLKSKNISVDCVIDINPQKQGHYIPGTGTLIIPPHEKNIADVDIVIISNSVYSEEIKRICISLGYSPVFWELA